MNPNYDMCIRQPRKAAERITELEKQLEAAIDWHYDEAVEGVERQDIVDNIKLLTEGK